MDGEVACTVIYSRLNCHLNVLTQTPTENSDPENLDPETSDPFIRFFKKGASASQKEARYLSSPVYRCCVNQTVKNYKV